MLVLVWFEVRKHAKPFRSVYSGRNTVITLWSVCKSEVWGYSLSKGCQNFENAKGPFSVFLCNSHNVPGKHEHADDFALPFYFQLLFSVVVGRGSSNAVGLSPSIWSHPLQRIPLLEEW